MAATNRGYHAISNTYYNWQSRGFDPDGDDYAGPVPFGELEGVVVIAVYPDRIARGFESSVVNAGASAVLASGEPTTTKLPESSLDFS